MSQETMIRDALAGAVSVGEQVTLKGWVRTRRDSKAGFSFVNLHDGSCFDAIQVVVPNDLENYEDEILKLTSGASIVATGELVDSPGKGQKFEVDRRDGGGGGRGGGKIHLEHGGRASKKAVLVTPQLHLRGIATHARQRPTSGKPTSRLRRPAAARSARWGRDAPSRSWPTSAAR